MKKNVSGSKKWLSGFLVVVLFFAGCSILDPTETVNLETTADDLEAAADGATVTFVNGIEQRVTECVDMIAWYTGGLTDEFTTQSDEFPTSTNEPRANNFRNTIGYQQVHEVRALADFVINTVIPNDALVTDESKGLAYFYRGIAFLVSAENFYRMPIAPDTEALTWGARLELAINDFKTALPLNENLETVIHLLLARAYRMKGDDTNAKTEADAAIASGSDDFVYFVYFDPNSNFANYNELWDVVTGTVTNDVQPLPRLDFLDPKYTEFDQPIALAKMEEAYLILAEIALSDGDYEGAKTSLSEAVRIANERPREEVTDIDNRAQWFNRGLAPSAEVLVKADADAPALPGLVQARYGAFVSVPVISGSSLDDEAILNLPTATTADREELLRLVYLSRQEIFFFEGRRTADLGMRRQMSREEWEQNDKIQNGDPGTDGGIFVPEFIPVGEDMDEWDVDTGGPVPVVTILWDMNKVLVENRGNAPVLDGLRTTLPFDFPF